MKRVPKDSPRPAGRHRQWVAALAPLLDVLAAEVSRQLLAGLPSLPKQGKRPRPPRKR
jgi:hypothetical protein